MIFWQLFWEFFKTGLLSVGGGLATLPFLQNIADKYGWYTSAELLNMFAVAESTPGSIGINIATYTGYETIGVFGALVATVSLVLPSGIIIILISRALNQFQESNLVKDAFYGLRPASAALILGAMTNVFLSSLLHIESWGGWNTLPQVLNVPAILIFLLLLVAIILLPRVHPIVFIVLGAVCGVAFGL